MSRKLWTVLAVMGCGLIAGCGGSNSPGGPFTVRVPSTAMLPTYRVGERLAVRPDGRPIRRNDVVALNPPKGADSGACGIPQQPADGHPCGTPTVARSSQVFVKRVVGLAGDRLKVIRGRTYIDGRAAREPFISDDPGCEICNLPKEIAVPPGYVFVVGDNRGQSADSRLWGPVRTRWILGRVVGPAGR